MKQLKLLAIILGLFGLNTLPAAETTPIKIGDKAPSFTLTSANNKQVSLSDYQGKDIVLIFSRAHW